MIQDCLEQILDDVVRIDLVPASACHFSVPFSVVQDSMSVANLSDWTPHSTTHAVIGNAELSVAYNVQEGDDGLMDSAPKLKQQPKTTASGLVINHDLQVPVVMCEDIQHASRLLHRRDFHVLLSTVIGTLYLIYALPNSSEVLLDESDVYQEATLKIALKSTSYAIRLK